MRRDGIVVGKEELHEIGDGGLVEGKWWVDGEGVVEVAWEGIDGGCH